jgi:mRNA interferase RelE/StbE
VSHRLLILPRAEKQLARMPPDAYPRLRDAIRSLAAEPRPSGCRKLRGREGYRLRVGSYRIVYRIDDSERAVTVLDLGHRRDVYR